MNRASRAETAGEDIAAGGSSFDANDRLAIMTLINSYGYLSDEFQMDRFFALFTTYRHSYYARSLEHENCSTWSTTASLGIRDNG